MSCWNYTDNMATTEELRVALRNAHSAGDAAAAKRIAKILETQQEQESLKKLETGIKEEKKQARFETAKDYGRAAISGPLRGTIGLLEFPEMIKQAASGKVKQLATKIAPKQKEGITKYFDALQQLQKTAPGGDAGRSIGLLTQALRQQPQTKELLEYQPESRGARYLQSAGEYTFPTMGFGPLRGLKVGAPTGAVAEKLEEAEVSPYVSIPLTLAAGGVSSYVTDPNRAVKLAAETLKGVPQVKIDLAKTVEAYAESQGVKLTAPELIQGDILTKLGESVYNSPQGGRIMYEYIKNRPQEMQKIAENLFDNYIAKNPESLRKVYKDANISAEKAFDEATTERTLKSQQAGYSVANNEFIDESQVLNLINNIDNVLKPSVKGTPKNKLKQLRNRLIKKTITPKDETVNILDQYGKPLGMQSTEIKIIPESGVNNLSEILRETRETIARSKAGKANPKEALTNSEIKKIAPALNELDEILKTNTNYLAGTEKYKELTNTIVNPALEAVEPFLIGKGVTPSKVKNQIFGIANVKPSDIRETYTRINKIDKQAFPNLARAYFDQIIDQTLYKTTEAGRPSFGAGFDLYKGLAGTKNLDKNFNAVLSGVAEARGLNKNEVLRGFDKFNEILKRTATLANVDNPKKPPDAMVLTREAAQVGAFMWTVKFANKFSNRVQEKTSRQLAEIFVNKNSVEELEKLARIDISKGEGLKSVINILAFTNNLDYMPEVQQEIENIQRQEYQQPLSQPQVPIQPTPQ
tara:strand:+ start:889 stop:3150 length:2262 start_codon:yes stop_codon:yes gene_type:complete